MQKTRTADSIRERFANTRYAARSGELTDILLGKEQIRAGVSVEVSRAGDCKAPNGETYHVAIHASTESISRDAGIVPISAWERGGLVEFNKNPVILAFHNHREFPVAKSVFTEIRDSKLDQYWNFHEETAESRVARALYEKGYMRAASVGFLVHEFAFIDELNEKEYEALVKKYGANALRDVIWIAQRAELLETSAVPVGSDPNALEFSAALGNARAAGMEVEALANHPGWQQPRSPEVPMKTPNQKSTEASETQVSTEKPVEKSADEQLGDLRTALEAAGEQIRELTTKLEDAVQRITNLETTRAAEPAATASGDESETVELEIEKLEGETDEQALARYVDGLVAERTGAPAPGK